ncbi:MAG: mercuric transport protein MerTP [Brumimicrobium sp.]|nr:mercuric transport protein MerTP [Brumimicrobium sp.]
MKTNNKIAGVGLLTAIAASLCCITPVIALLAGTSGMAATFSWMEPARPYLIAFTILTLGFAWYQKLKPKKELDCNCDTEEKKSFMQSKLFLGIITVFAALMLSFPYYSHMFYTNNNSAAAIDAGNAQKMEFTIEGMTCTSCEVHVTHEIMQLDGIHTVEVSYDNGNALVEFDKRKTNQTEITKAINSTGYTVTDTKNL